MKTSFAAQTRENGQHKLGPITPKNNQQSRFRDLIRYFAPRIFFSFLFFVLSVVLTQAQEDNLNTNSRIILRQAMLDIDRLKYDKAITKLLQLRWQHKENANINYLLGSSYLYSSSSMKSVEQAAFYLSQASKKISPDYQTWDLSESSAPSEVLYHLGKAQEKLGNYSQAAEAFEDFLVILSEDENIQRSKMYRVIEKTALEFQLAVDKEINQSAEKTNLAQSE